MVAAVLDGVPFLDCGVAAHVYAGQSRSGDSYVLVPTPAGALVAVVDGLGHGGEAADAAERAAEVLADHASDSVIGLVRRCHNALIGTRGVALSLAAFDAREDTVTWLAVGNVEALLVRADAHAAPRREAIVMRGGVVGARLPLLQASMTTVVRGDLLVFATDGIKSGFADRLDVSLPAQQLADQILAGYGRDTDDALVLVCRYAGRRAAAT